MPPDPNGKPGTPGDGKVDSYQRVVNGKVVNVNAYAKKSNSTTRAAKTVLRRPGRPRLAAQPGSYTSGRSIPGIATSPVKPPKPPSLQQPQQPPPPQPTVPPAPTEQNQSPENPADQPRGSKP